MTIKEPKRDDEREERGENTNADEQRRVSAAHLRDAVAHECARQLHGRRFSV